MIVNKLITDFLSLFFPRQCAACHQYLVTGEHILCLACWHDLPLTNWEHVRDNTMEQMLWGRFPFERATSLFHFHKESKYREMMHLYKYKGQYQIGFTLGKLLGNKLRETHEWTFDAIVPIPLHTKKQRQRGYNQSEWVAKGIAEVWQCPVLNQLLVRIQNNPSQTGQTREQRWENIQSAFILNQNVQEPLHLLLVDDIITTGATLEAAARELMKIPGIKISVATLAATER